MAGPAAAFVSKVWGPVMDPTLAYGYLRGASGMQQIETAATGMGLQPPASVLTEQASKATASAFDMLAGRFGVQATDKTQLGDEWFLKGQTDEQAQPGKER